MVIVIVVLIGMVVVLLVVMVVVVVVVVIVVVVVVVVVFLGALMLIPNINLVVLCITSQHTSHSSNNTVANKRPKGSYYLKILKRVNPLR